MLLVQHRFFVWCCQKFLPPSCFFIALGIVIFKNKYPWNDLIVLLFLYSEDIDIRKFLTWGNRKRFGYQSVCFTKNNLNRFIRFRLFLFKTEGLVYGINSQCELHGIAARPRMASADRLYSPFPFVLDSIQCNWHWFHARLWRDSIPQQVADSIQCSALIWYGGVWRWNETYY